MGRNIQGEYPPDWPALAKAVKNAAGWRCVRCGHPHERPGAHVDCDDRCDLARHPEWTEVAPSPPALLPGWSMTSRGKFWELRGRRRQRVLTVAHLDDDKANGRWWNLAALCQVCHLSTQSRIEMRRPWMLEHSAWFRPYVAGYYAWTRLGVDLSRAEVESRLSELLSLGRVDTALDTDAGTAVRRVP